MIDSFQGEHRFLSNFYPCKISCRGVPLPSNEHYYVVRKLDVSDEATLRHISKLTAGGVKRYGRENTQDPKMKDTFWRLTVMMDGLRQKFSWHKNPELTNMLINTGDNELVEGNHWGDTFWGVCDGVGHNHLGKLLMNHRKRLIDF